MKTTILNRLSLVMHCLVILWTVPMIYGAPNGASSSCALRTESPPILDGTLDASWNQALSIDSEMYQDDPLLNRALYTKAKFYIMWDNERLYLAADVLDPEHFQENTGAMIWDGDAIQLGVAISPVDKKKAGWSEYAVALTAKGPELYTWKNILTEHGVSSQFTKTLPKEQVAVKRNEGHTVYEFMLSAADIGLERLAAGTELRFAYAFLDKARGKTLKAMTWGKGLVFEEKNPDAYGTLKLVEAISDMQISKVAVNNLVPNFSFEYGKEQPASWQYIPHKIDNCTGIWEQTESHSGSHAIGLKIENPTSGVGNWACGVIDVQPNTRYLLSCYNKCTIPSGHWNQLIIGAGEKPVIMELGFGHDWRIKNTRFVTGQNQKKLTMSFIVNAYMSAGVSWLDDVFIKEDKIIGQELKEKRVAIITDDANSVFCLMLLKLYPDEVGIYDIAAIDRHAQNDIAAFRNIVFDISNQDNVARVTAIEGFITDYVSAGKVVIMDLEEYAFLRKLQVMTTIEKEKDIKDLLQISAEKQRLLQAELAKLPREADKSILYSHTRKLSEKWMVDYIDQLRPDTGRIKSSLKVTGADQMVTGFPVGSIIPWCGRGKDATYIQRQLQGVKNDERRKILAVSTMNDSPILIRKNIEKGTVYALDLKTLGEPVRGSAGASFRTRGAFHKYIFLGNVLYKSIDNGVEYWNKKPTYDEFLGKLKDLVKEFPVLKLNVEGYVNGYNIYGVTIGDPTKPQYFYIANFHQPLGAEWEADTTGAYSFIKYLALHADEEPLKTKLSNNCVKIIPIVRPDCYMSAFRGEQRGNEEKLPPAYPETQRDKVYAFVQLHEGCSDIAIMPEIELFYLKKESKPLVIRMHEYAKGLIKNRNVYWDDWFTNAPRSVLEGSPLMRDLPPDCLYMTGYWYFYHVGEKEIRNAACKTMLSCESPMYLRALKRPSSPDFAWLKHLPPIRDFGETSYMNCWINQGVTSICLAYLLADD